MSLFNHVFFSFVGRLDAWVIAIDYDCVTNIHISQTHLFVRFYFQIDLISRSNNVSFSVRSNYQFFVTINGGFRGDSSNDILFPFFIQTLFISFLKTVFIVCQLTLKVTIYTVIL